jgi:hypothetical protein
MSDISGKFWETLKKEHGFNEPINQDEKWIPNLDQTVPSEVFKKDSKSDDSVPEEFSQEKKEPVPLQIVLSKTQTSEQIRDVLKKASRSIKEDGKKISFVRVPIQGYEGTSLHPAMIKSAKSKYAEAVNCGLIGFLMNHGFQQEAREVYCIAYATAQRKGKDRIRFKNIDKDHMTKTFYHSIEVYMNLVEG